MKLESGFAKLKSSHLLFLFFFLFLTVSCNKDPEIDEPVAALPEWKLHEESYGQHERQHMDVYLPKGRTLQTPVLVMIHGGFWVEGDKRDFRIIQQQLLSSGIATINLNYRYASEHVHIDDMIQDVATAVEYVSNHHQEWGIVSDKYHILGFSAGGHLALMYGYRASPSLVASIISVAGPVELTAELLQSPILTGQARQGLEWMAGRPIPSSMDDPNYIAYQQASPMYHLRRETAKPTLMIHGTADEVVPYTQSQSLTAALQALGVRHKLVPLQDAGHDMTAHPLHIITALAETRSWLLD